MKLFRSLAIMTAFVLGFSVPVFAAGTAAAAEKTEAEILQEQVAEQFLEQLKAQLAAAGITDPAQQEAAIGAMTQAAAATGLTSIPVPAADAEAAAAQNAAESAAAQQQAAEAAAQAQLAAQQAQLEAQQAAAAAMLTQQQGAMTEILQQQSPAVQAASMAAAGLTQQELASRAQASFQIAQQEVKKKDPKAPAPPKCEIVYDFGDGRYFELNSQIAMTLMVTNPNGTYAVDQTTKYYVIDPAKLAAFVSSLQTQYSKRQSALTFHSTNKGVLSMSGGTYLNRYIYSYGEYLYLPDAILGGRQEMHIPSYDVGDTYIEVDIGNQTLYYYQNSQLALQTPIVTGNTSNGHNTPTGIYYVRTKQLNQTLVGRGYASFVHYWMPIVGNSIGIHDATWRRSFGGNIYTYNGSHGCINLPLDMERTLYSMVTVGTPAIVIP